MQERRERPRLMILTTGSRHLADPTPVARMLQAIARGVDAGDVLVMHARACPGWAEVPMDADWETFGRGAGPARNARMADAAAAMKACGWRLVVLAMPADGSRGTLDMIRRARAAGFVLFERGLAADECRRGLGMTRIEAATAVCGMMSMGRWPMNERNAR